MTLRRGGAVFANPESESVRMVEGSAVYTYTPGTQTDPFAVGGRKVILYQGLDSVTLAPSLALTLTASTDPTAPCLS